VADSSDGRIWRFLGILPLYDPPRDDSRETIGQAYEHGLEVKMVTGDNVAIAREISGQLGMGRNIRPARELVGKGDDPDHLTQDQVEQIRETDGFAEVFPEHKYAIVKALQDRGHIVAMTGDGVNDAPALKQAGCGHCGFGQYPERPHPRGTHPGSSTGTGPVFPGPGKYPEVSCVFDQG
jgi:H+-transporting ATPase